MGCALPRRTSLCTAHRPRHANHRLPSFHRTRLRVIPNMKKLKRLLPPHSKPPGPTVQTNTATTTQIGTQCVSKSSGPTESVRTDSASTATGSINTGTALSSGTVEELPLAHCRSDILPTSAGTPASELASPPAGPDAKDKDTTVGTVSGLEAAVQELTVNYETFITRNEQFLRIPENALNRTFLSIDAEIDIRQAAKAFGYNVKMVLDTVEQKHKIRQENWSTKVGSFLTKCYPIARLSLELAGAIGEVTSSSPITSDRRAPLSVL